MLKECIQKSRVEIDGREISELSKIKGIYLVLLMGLSMVVQWLLIVAGMYFVWIKNIQHGALMFLIALGCWLVKYHAREVFWKLT